MDKGLLLEAGSVGKQSEAQCSKSVDKNFLCSPRKGACTYGEGHNIIFSAKSHRNSGWREVTAPSLFHAPLSWALPAVLGIKIQEKYKATRDHPDKSYKGGEGSRGKTIWETYEVIWLAQLLAHGVTLGVVLCRVRSWTLTVLVGPF